MAETGVLRPDARVELLNGQIVDMSPIGPLHGSVVNRLTRIFNLQSRKRWFVSSQNSLRVDDYSEPQPDVMLLRSREDDYASAHPEPSDVYLLVEVSDSTVDLDQKEKLAIYAESGVGEVWIVNLVDDQVEIYREPAFGRYSVTATASKEETISPVAFPDLQISVGELLKR